MVTKHGEPVARLVPYTARLRTMLFGSMRGTVLAFERPFDPVDGEWDAASADREGGSPRSGAHLRGAIAD